MGYVVVGRCNKKPEGGGVRGAPRFRIYWHWDCHRDQTSRDASEGCLNTKSDGKGQLEGN